MTGRTVLVAHPGTGLYGADRMLLESVHGLRSADVRVVVALPSIGPLVAELLRLGAEVEIVRTLALSARLLRPRAWPTAASVSVLGIVRIWRLLGRLRPDTVYVSTSGVPQWPLIARARGIRSISHIHEAPRSDGRRVNRLRLLPHLASHRTLVNSQYTLETIRRALPSLARRAEIVPNGVVSPEHPPLPREPLESPLRVLYMGRFSPRKGPDLALEAATLLQLEGHQVQLTMLGEPAEGFEWFDRQLREQACAGDLEVEFAGFQQDVWPFLADVDVLLAPSRFDEAFGNSAVEAVLALRPVIASDTSGLREAVGDYRSVHLVPVGDARALANSLLAVSRSWSTTVRSLASSRAEALRRHDPGTYRSTIVRACGVDTSGPHGSRGP
ncbi:glycosyltransferase [Brachybacterium sp.]|uniref:glycosyltransferase n=1 Tax=Brachybacterium sp. TaxID=1891286 RepID=UPI002ED3B21D